MINDLLQSKHQQYQLNKDIACSPHQDVPSHITIEETQLNLVRFKAPNLILISIQNEETNEA